MQGVSPGIAFSIPVEAPSQSADLGFSDGLTAHPGTQESPNQIGAERRKLSEPAIAYGNVSRQQSVHADVEVADSSGR